MPREDTFSGESAEGPVKCAGERPILQKPHGLVIELPQTPWIFDLPRELPGTNQKIPSLRSQRLCGESNLFCAPLNR